MSIGVAGVRKPDSLGPCTSHSFLPLLKSCWLKGLRSSLELSELAHLYYYRTYAITWKSKWVAGVLYTISATNFSVGLYMSIHAAQVPGQHTLHYRACTEVPEGKGLTVLMTGIPLDSYHACFPHVGNSLIVTQLALALSFGKYITPPAPIYSNRPFCLFP